MNFNGQGITVSFDVSWGAGRRLSEGDVETEGVDEPEAGRDAILAKMMEMQATIMEMYFLIGLVALVLVALVAWNVLNRQAHSSQTNENAKHELLDSSLRDFA